MNKDIEWLKEKVEEMYTHYSISNNFDFVSKREAITEISNLIDQLDEPEVLSQKWIDEHKWDNDHIWKPFVCVEDLQTLLVPKQEKVKIPQFVAEWVEEAKDRKMTLYGAIHECPREVDYWLVDGDSSNQETFARAWLDGFTVEEEQKYILSINITDKASKTDYETFLNKRGIFHSMENNSFNSEEFNWTEEEIRGLTKGDILFEHFAVKVEELEE